MPEIVRYSPAHGFEVLMLIQLFQITAGMYSTRAEHSHSFTRISEALLAIDLIDLPDHLQAAAFF